MTKLSLIDSYGAIHLIILNLIAKFAIIPIERGH